MFCTKCGAKLSDQAKFCTSCGEPVKNNTKEKNFSQIANNSKSDGNCGSVVKAPVKQSKKKHQILIALVVVVVLFIIIAACGDTGDIAGENSTENTLQSEEIIVTNAPSTSEPKSEATTDLTYETEEPDDEAKYPKSYNEKGELIVYWLDSGSVWHESTKCSTVMNADPAKIHSGIAYAAYSSGKARACKICSSDSTVVIPETTHAPETTIVPETTKTPETTIPTETTSTPETSIAPETTQEETLPQTEELKYQKSYDDNGELIVYWFNNGAAWHESIECSVIRLAFLLKLNEGSATEAYLNGKTHPCSVCSSDSTVVIPEITIAPETTSIPETTSTPETTSAPETTKTPETTRTPETTKTPETTSSPDDTRTVYWVTEGYVWHYSRNCRTLDKTDSFLIYSGYASEAKAIGKERACKVCADGSTIEIPETTVEPEVTTEPEETHSPSTDDGLTIVSWPVTASRNEVVSVTIRGEANTKYYIEVNYNSGPSTSKDLNPKVSDSNGEVTWTWKVGGRSAAGTFDIIVKDDDGNSVTVEWTVLG